MARVTLDSPSKYAPAANNIIGHWKQPASKTLDCQIPTCNMTEPAWIIICKLSNPFVECRDGNDTQKKPAFIWPFAMF